MHFPELLLRVLLSIVMLSVMAKVSGAKQISQLTFYDYIAGIVVGSLAGELCLDHDIPIWQGIIAIMIFLLHSVFMSVYTRKSMTLRRFFIGKPIFLIAQGVIQCGGLKRGKFDVNMLLSELRSLGFFDIRAC